MQQKSGVVNIVFGILGVLGAFFNGLFAAIFGIMGIAFAADPYSVDVSANGRQLYGEEAAEAALKMAAIFKGIGAVTLVLCICFVVLAIVMFVKFAKIQKENAMYAKQYQNNQYNMGGAQTYQNNQYNVNGEQTTIY